MRLVSAAGFAILFAACATATLDTPASVLTPAGALPDTIDCNHPLVVKARTEREGIQAEQDWLDAHYPGHSEYAQALLHSNHRSFDVLTFTASDGRTISVCFDITSFFGKW